MAEVVIGIDASRNRSGGAQAHIIGLIGGADPRFYGVRTVHLWAHKALMARVPDRSWLEKHTPGAAEGNLMGQLWWQFRRLPEEAVASGCDLMFNADAGTVCPFQPSVTLSQDMLVFEPGEMRRYRFSKAWLRLAALKVVQRRSLSRADGAIFLTEYARTVIQRSTGVLAHSTVINHGINEEFVQFARPRGGLSLADKVRTLYVSNAAPYKHQWHVVDAIARLRKMRVDVSLLLVGGGAGRAQERLRRAIQENDPAGEFVTQLPFADNASIPRLLADADIFVFASSCESMPITLIEAMASGIPIACADRGPMPEILSHAGVYFDPEDPETIAGAILRLISDSALRAGVSANAARLAREYTWAKCASDTWRFLYQCATKQLPS